MEMTQFVPQKRVATWRTIPQTDRAGFVRFLEIVQQMDKRYLEWTLPSLRSTVLRHRGELHHAQGDGFELVMGYFWSPRSSCYYLWNIGMAGAIEVDETMDHLIDRLEMFLKEHGQSSVIAIRPWTMTFAPAHELLNRVPTHPRLNVTTVSSMNDSELWRLQPRDLIAA